VEELLPENDLTASTFKVSVCTFEGSNNYFTRMCSGSEAGSYSMLIPGSRAF
jgi:hypothetical protein